MRPAHQIGRFAGNVDNSLQPSFGAAGTGATVGTGVGVVDVPYPSGIVAGSLLILHVAVRTSTTTNILTPNGWYAIEQAGNASDQSRIMVKIATGSESGSLSVSFLNPSTTSAMGRMYRFADATGLDSYASLHDLTSDTTATAVDQTTTTSRTLALQLIWGGANTTIASMTGESGADYTEAVAEFGNASNPAGVLGLQTAVVPQPQAITGGSATMGASSTDIVHAAAIHSKTEGDVVPDALDWGNIVSITTSGSNSAQTINGISGKMLLQVDINVTVGSGTIFVNRNSVGDWAVADNGGLLVKNGDTVSFRATRLGAVYQGDITVKNGSAGGTTLDTFTFSVDPI